jgi:hypothetical protein
MTASARRRVASHVAFPARRTARLVLAAALLGAPVADAAPRLADVGGHLTLGYARLFAPGGDAGPARETPGGSLSAGVGVDLPVSEGLRAGLDVGYHLLGSRTLVQGSLTSGLDYSVFEALAVVHWAPGGPPLRLTAGPGLFIVHADLASSPIGAAFSDLAVAETRLGAALGVALARRTGVVRAGLEAGVRLVPLDGETWSLALVRLALQY